MTFSPFVETTNLKLNSLRLDLLQSAVRTNQVSLPAQIPFFVRHAPRDLECHVVQLYFVHGWSREKIALRYGRVRNYIGTVLSEWRRHAVALGYVQVIPPMAYPTPVFVGAPCLNVDFGFDPLLGFMPANYRIALPIEECRRPNRGLERKQGPAKLRDRPLKNPVSAPVPSSLIVQQRWTRSTAQRKAQSERMKAYWRGRAAK